MKVPDHKRRLVPAASCQSHCHPSYKATDRERRADVYCGNARHLSLIQGLSEVFRSTVEQFATKRLGNRSSSECRTVQFVNSGLSLH